MVSTFLNPSIWFIPFRDWQLWSSQEKSKGSTSFTVDLQLSLLMFLFRVQLREPVLNDELPGRIITGKVVVKPSIKEVKENSVVFNNTAKEEPIDIIIFATGYTFAFPFLDESVVKVEDGQASLYKYIFPAHLPKPTLAVIGLIKPLGSMVPTGETQARWVVQVLKGNWVRKSWAHLLSCCLLCEH